MDGGWMSEYILMDRWDGWIGGWIHGWMDGWMGGWVDTNIERWLDRWVDVGVGWMGGYVGGYTDGCDRWVCVSRDISIGEAEVNRDKQENSV